MRVDRLAGFDAFVAERGDALVALARGLCARDEDAEDLLEAALATVVRRWRRPAVREDPSGATVRELVRLAARRSRRGRDVERPVVVHGEADLDELAPAGASGWGPADPTFPGGPSGPAGPGGAGSGVDDDPVAALRTVPVGQRVVLLLRWLEDLDDDEVAGVLGLDADEVAARARAALAAMGLPPRPSP